MTQPAKSQEPSMEEILASIRRIIADDDAGKLVQRDGEAPKVAAAATPSTPSFGGLRSEPPMPRATTNVDDQTADILDLTESMATPMLNHSRPAAAASAPAATPAPQFRKIEPHGDVGFDEPIEKPAGLGSSRPAAEPRTEFPRARLLSSDTSAAVDSAFNTLAQTVLVQNGRTLEDLVREMLRPLLKSWLDENLPGMVERLVRGEIERVSRGHG